MLRPRLTNYPRLRYSKFLVQSPISHFPPVQVLRFPVSGFLFDPSSLLLAGMVSSAVLVALGLVHLDRVGFV